MRKWILVAAGLAAGAPATVTMADAPMLYPVAAPRTNPSTPPGMVLVPAGSFNMGDHLGENSWWWPFELPVHEVDVSVFLIERYEVTKAQWDEVAEWAASHGYDITAAGGAGKASNHPVQGITWYDCAKWCNARSEKEGLTAAYYMSAERTTVYRTGEVNVLNDWVRWDAGYRLPTEAEWEKAARGGAVGQRFPWSDSAYIDHSRANYYCYWDEWMLPPADHYSYDNASPGYHPDYNDGEEPYTSPVGSFAPNGYGLYDMAGNVSELCWDWWSGGYYGVSPGSDPRGPASGSSRAYRGGSWFHDAKGCRVACRGSFNPDGSDYNMGFRAVLPPGQHMYVQMDVQGNSVPIAHGDSTPSLTDHTDFGSLPIRGGTLVRTYTIRNMGTSVLDLTGSPRVAISGQHAAYFTVTMQPAEWVDAGGTTSFQVTFAPLAVGGRTATLSIANNVENANPYNFSIQGVGTPPEELAIRSFGKDGTVTFNEIPNATGYQVEARSGGEWSSFAQIPASGSGMATATVSMLTESLLCRVVATVEDPYLVIDLSGGSEAASYPVSSLSEVPAGGWTEEHRTTKLVLRWIPAGTFTMGSPTNELGRNDWMDGTQHEVTLTQDFYVGVFEVTQEQWYRVVGNWPGYFNNATCRASRPVEQVSYYDIRGSSAGAGWPESSEVDADSFLGRLRAKTGLAELDLPTEAQWEYACRAWTVTALNSGKNLTSEFDCKNVAEVGRYWRNGGSEGNGNQGVDTTMGTARVGSYLPNGWGLYDMHGNVFEWCLDWYGGYPGDAVDPLGEASGWSRVLRGGSWDSVALYCRSANRVDVDPSDLYFIFGFRLAGTLP